MRDIWKLSRNVSMSKISSDFHRIMRKVPWIPLVILLIFIVFGIFGSHLVPHDPLKTNLGFTLMPPFWQKGGSLEYPLGTDSTGRDVLSRLIVGASVSLKVGFGVIIISAFIGAIIGLLSGYLGGWVDMVLMRITDIFFSLPALLFAIVIASILGPGLTNMIIVLAVLGWAGYARILRGEVLRIKQGDFISLAVVAGASKRRIMWRHLFPNIVNTMVVIASFHLGNAIVAESSLSFLGVGVPPPTPAWGSMCAIGRDYLYSAWWLATFPGLAIFLVVMSTNLLGDWLRVRLDPKFRQL